MAVSVAAGSRLAPARHRAARAPRTAGGGTTLLVVVASAAMLVVMADTVASSVAIAVLARPPLADPVVAPEALAHTLGLASRPWLATAFLVPFAAFLGVGGQLADRLGHRFVLGCGLVIFACATVALLAAPTWLTMLAWRTAQAGGASLMIPASLGLLVAHLPDDRRRVGIGWWTGAGGLGAVLLQGGGGVLASTWGWRGLFMPGLALAAVVVCLLPALPRDRGSTGGRPDVPGAALLALGVGAVVLIICQGEVWGWTSRRILAVAVVAVVGLGGALLRARTHPHPAVPVQLWRHGGVRWGWLMSALYGLLSAPILVFGPSFLGADGVGVGGWRACFWLVPLSAAVLIGGPLAGLAGRRAGPIVLAYSSAMLVIAAGTVLAWALQADAGRPNAPAALAALAGLGLGLGVLSQVAAAAGSQTRLAGQFAAASAASMTLRQSGGALGVAVASVLLKDPFVAGPAAGYHSILAACLVTAGLCGVAAVARPLCRAWATIGTARPAAGTADHSPDMALVPRTMLMQLHQALTEVAQAADAWMVQQDRATAAPQPVPSSLAPLISGGSLSPVATGSIARRCACHPELDPLEATILHTAHTGHHRPRRPVRERIRPVESAPLPGGHHVA
ncbi:MFS transporter [Nonomuraea sp. NPDC046802]|uniref:MFS transporter n=1 Tax=Nonomuraea sp. NPDC046802 TaxID=3154919 RepID=UPI0033DD13EB